jgi:hypothetical protein
VFEDRSLETASYGEVSAVIWIKDEGKFCYLESVWYFTDNAGNTAVAVKVVQATCGCLCLIMKLSLSIAIQPQYIYSYRHLFI